MAVDSLGSIQSNREKYADLFDNSSNDTMSIDTFYTLLIAEMSNQDPMEPMSNTEFISQMASFTSLQSQNTAVETANANYAASLIGKTVSLVDGGSLVTGTVTGTAKSNKQQTLTVNGNDYLLSAVQSVLQTDTSGNVSTTYSVNDVSSDGAYATSLIGKYVTVKTTDSAGNNLLDGGIVDSVEYVDGVFRIAFGDYSYDVGSVVLVQNPSEVSKSDDETAEETTQAATDSSSDEADVYDLFDV